MGNAQQQGIRLTPDVAASGQLSSIQNIPEIPTADNVLDITIQRYNTGKGSRQVGFIKGLKPLQIPKLTPEQIKNFDPLLLSILRPEQVKAFTNDQLKLFTKAEQLNALFGITDAQNATIPHVIKLTAEQIINLSIDQLSVLHPRIKQDLINLEQKEFDESMKKLNLLCANTPDSQQCQDIMRKRQALLQGRPQQYGQPQPQQQYAPPSYGGKRKNKKHNKKHKTRTSKKRSKKTRRNR